MYSGFIIRKRGHPRPNDELFHHGVEGMEWGKRVDYSRGIGWVGDGISKKLNLPPPFHGRKKQQGGLSAYGKVSSKAPAAKASATRTRSVGGAAGSMLLKRSGKSSSSSSSAASGGGGGSSDSTSKYDPDLRAKLDAMRGNSEKAQKEREKAEKKAEQERKKKEREEAAAKRKQEAEAKRKAAEEERERKKREAEENKAYKQRLAIERQARQLFDKWKQEEVRKKKTKDNTLKKSQVSFVGDRGKAKSWRAPKRSRINRMI